MANQLVLALARQLKRASDSLYDLAAETPAASTRTVQNPPDVQPVEPGPIQVPSAVQGTAGQPALPEREVPVLPEGLSPALPDGVHPADVPSPDAGDRNDPDWVRLVEDCVDLMDELDRFDGKLDESAAAVIDHILLRMEDILDQAPVERIEGDGAFDNLRHRSSAGKRVPQGAPILATLHPGYRLGSRILRRALVSIDWDRLNPQ